MSHFMDWWLYAMACLVLVVLLIFWAVMKLGGREYDD